jgi:hypothetical protein
MRIGKEKPRTAGPRKTTWATARHGKNPAAAAASTGKASGANLILASMTGHRRPGAAWNPTRVKNPGE